MSFKNEMCSAPGRLRTIISHQQISDLKGNVNPMNTIQRKELPNVGASRAVAERKITGEAKLIVCSICRTNKQIEQ